MNTREQARELLKQLWVAKKQCIDGEALRTIYKCALEQGGMQSLEPSERSDLLDSYEEMLKLLTMCTWSELEDILKAID